MAQLIQCKKPVCFVGTVEGITKTFPKNREERITSLRTRTNHQSPVQFMIVKNPKAISPHLEARGGSSDSDCRGNLSHLALIPLYQVAQSRLSKCKFSSLEPSTIHHRRSLSGSGCGYRLRPGMRVRLGWR